MIVDACCCRSASGGRSARADDGPIDALVGTLTETEEDLRVIAVLEIFLTVLSGIHFGFNLEAGPAVSGV